MRSWIIKYKVEFASNEVPSDDAHDCRELAKWYHIWRILFPDYEGPVPSPCMLSLNHSQSMFEALTQCSSERLDLTWRFEAGKIIRNVPDNS